MCTVKQGLGYCENCQTVDECVRHSQITSEQLKTRHHEREKVES
jgi:hypothetical protein